MMRARFGFLALFLVIISHPLYAASTVQLPAVDGTIKSVPAHTTRYPDGSQAVHVSLQDIAQMLGGELLFDPTTQFCVLATQGMTSRFLAGSPIFVLIPPKGAPLAGELPQAPILRDGRILISKAAALVYLEQYRKTSRVEPVRTEEPPEARRVLPRIEKPASDAPKVGAQSGTAGEVPPTSYPEPIVRPPARKLAPFIRSIVIDAGHGDHDAGAVGPGGTMEKDVNLAVAREFAARLREEVAGKVTLTRGEDKFLSLKERVAVAKRGDADIFISIHSNSVPKRNAAQATGTEVYFFSKPNDAHAAEAEKLHGGPFDPAAEGIDPVLWNLMLAGNVIESHKLAETVQKRFPGRVGLASRGVKSARFYVLYYGVLSNFPCILIEMGFISHTEEEKKLADPEWQVKAAEAITESVVEYLKDLENRYPNGAGWTRS